MKARSSWDMRCRLYFFGGGHLSKRLVWLITCSTQETRMIGLGRLKHDMILILAMAMTMTMTLTWYDTTWYGFCLNMGVYPKQTHPFQWGKLWQTMWFRDHKSKFWDNSISKADRLTSHKLDNQMMTRVLLGQPKISKGGAPVACTNCSAEAKPPESNEQSCAWA